MAEERRVIMMVDDDEATLAMGREILEDRYTIYPIPRGEKLFDIIKKVHPDLILLDVEMPEMTGYDVIRSLKENAATAEIPVIFITAHSDRGNELEGLTLGAVDYVTKPFSPPILVQRIENHLLIVSQREKLQYLNQSLQEIVNGQSLEIKNLQNAVLSVLSEVAGFRDPMGSGHVDRIVKYLRVMIYAMLEQKIYADAAAGWDVEVLVSAARIYDVGKIRVSEAILNKPGRLTPREFDEIKKYPGWGLEVIQRIQHFTGEYAFLDHARLFTAAHRERWDGAGYPKGLKGQDIPLQGRLLAIADVYDALVSARPYRQPLSPSSAAEEIIRGSGSAFDPALVDLFKTLTGEFAVIAEKNG